MGKDQRYKLYPKNPTAMDAFIAYVEELLNNEFPPLERGKDERGEYVELTVPEHRGSQFTYLSYAFKQMAIIVEVDSDINAEGKEAS